MANLKGGTFEKQCKDLFHRLEAFGKSRYGKDDHLSHSDAIATKRTMYANDFKNFLEQNNIEGKMNQAMNNENITSFFEQRLEGLAHSSQINYIRGWSSLIQGLQEVNLSVNIDKSIFDNTVAEIKANATPEVKTGLAVINSSEKIEQLYLKRYESGVLSEVMRDLGIRIAESYELVKNFESYYNPSNGTIENLKGKGNHIYKEKYINDTLIAKIRECENVPSQNTYRNDLKEVGINNPHLIKFTYAKAEFEKKLNDGVEYHQALRELSQELNHSRESMSLFYLGKA